MSIATALQGVDQLLDLVLIGAAGCVFAYAVFVNRRNRARHESQRLIDQIEMEALPRTGTANESETLPRPHLVLLKGGLLVATAVVTAGGWLAALIVGWMTKAAHAKRTIAAVASVGVAGAILTVAVSMSRPVVTYALPPTYAPGITTTAATSRQVPPLGATGPLPTPTPTSATPAAPAVTGTPTTPPKPTSSPATTPATAPTTRQLPATTTPTTPPTTPADPGKGRKGRNDGAHDAATPPDGHRKAVSEPASQSCSRLLLLSLCAPGIGADTPLGPLWITLG